MNIKLEISDTVIVETLNPGDVFKPLGVNAFYVVVEQCRVLQYAGVHCLRIFGDPGPEFSITAYSRETRVEYIGRLVVTE